MYFLKRVVAKHSEHWDPMPLDNDHKDIDPPAGRSRRTVRIIVGSGRPTAFMEIGNHGWEYRLSAG